MLKLFIGFLVTLCLLVFIILTALGLIPGVSALVGTGPKDLGIRITLADSQAAQAKDGTQYVSLPPNTPLNQDYVFEGKREVDLTFDSKELTAHSNNRAWKSYPLKNVQIRINPDGTIEGSAILIVSKALPYATALGYSESQIKEAMQKYHLPPFEVPFYVKGTGSVAEDQVSVNASMVKIGAIPIPSNIVSQANQEAKSVLEDIIHKHSQSFHAESVTFANGQMHFKGNLPATIHAL